jgi:hypothetical protein
MEKIIWTANADLHLQQINITQIVKNDLKVG